MREKKEIGEKYDVTAKERDLAERRTAFLIKRLIDFNIPLRTALASAYFQGIIDASDLIKEKRP
jgi:hypothetical protein